MNAESLVVSPLSDADGAGNQPVNNVAMYGWPAASVPTHLRTDSIIIWQQTLGHCFI